MKTIDKIIFSSTKFYNDLLSDNHGRYRSWEQCYTAFCDARSNSDIDYDYLSLILAFYLASWGMYRGSSFLLQRDYKVHTPVVKEIMKNKYDCLVGIKCIEYKKPEIRKLVFNDLKENLKDHYRKERLKVVNKKPQADISELMLRKFT